jgi:hypothetical protein
MTNNTGFILNLITLSINIFTCLILFIIWITIIHHVWYKLLKHEDRTIVILSANIYMIISFFTGILVSFNIQTLLGDLYKYNFNSSWCIFIGYLHSVIGGGLYWSFVNQVNSKLGSIINLKNLFSYYPFRVSFAFVALYIQHEDGFKMSGFTSFYLLSN